MTRRATLTILTVCMFLLVAVPAGAQWKIEGEDGSMIKLGLLVQGRAEWMEVPDNDDPEELEMAGNLYFRRVRILAGGRLSDKLSFFLETDSPNLGKSSATGAKQASDVFIQDAFLTYTFADEFMIDAGLILIPNSYNSEQSAAALLPVDYGPFSFLASTPTDSRVGRDYGLQLRGYLLDNHLQYRAGMYQGKKETDGTNDFRYNGRVVLHFLEPQTGFFYTGTSLGTKNIFDLGLSVDHQESYNAYAGDLFLDLKVGDGDGFTLQGDYLYYDGGEIFEELPAQNTWLGEMGYYSGASRLGVFAQVGVKDFVQSTIPDENFYEAGIAYWAKGHNFNLKLAYMLATMQQQDDRRGVVLQCQAFQF